MLRLLQPAISLHVRQPVTPVLRFHLFPLGFSLRHQVPTQLHSGHIAVFHPCRISHVRVHTTAKKKAHRRRLQRFPTVQQLLGPRISLISFIAFFYPLHLQARTDLQIEHAQVNFGSQRQIAETSEHPLIRLVRFGLQHFPFAPFHILWVILRHTFIRHAYHMPDRV